MIHQLEVPFRDTCADDLALTLCLEDVPPRAALATLAVRLGAISVELRVLSGSHEARVEGVGAVVSEVVGCDEPVANGLPATLARELPLGRYAFSATTDRRPAGAFAREADELVAWLDAHPNGLAGRFPGHPNAITGLCVDPCEAGVLWRTWHLYPGHNERVRTESRVTVA